jgi:hypothetical protein
MLTLAKTPAIAHKQEMRCAKLYGARARLMAWLWFLIWLPISGCAGLPNFELLPSGARRNSAPRSRFSRLSDARLQLQHLQIKGSHNSYHRAPRFALSPGWRYTHPPLEVQLAVQGVRQIELDVRYDRGEVLVGHLPLIDGRTTCRSLRDCLAELKRWSRAHPAHVPVFVFIEPKEDLVRSGLDGRIEVLESTITSSVPRDMLLLPEDVARGAPSMQEAIQRMGWPSLEESRGRIAFVLFGPARHRIRYGKGRPDLRGRAMFVASDSFRPEAAILNCDDPVRDAPEIASGIRRGLLVRTRADAGLVRKRERRDAALASGAHFVTTDFLATSDDWVNLGDSAPARCNPISAPRGCQNQSLAEIEDVLWAGLTNAL